MKNILLIVFFCCCITQISIGQNVPGLDYSFKNSGFVQDNSGPVYLKHEVLSDGSIIQLGTINLTSTSQRFGYVNKLNSDGSINTDFNLPNPVYPNSISFRGNENSYLTSIIKQPDGKIIVGGMTEYTELRFGTAVSLSDIALARLLPNGNLDPTFGIDGKFVLILSKGQNRITDIALSSTGEIIIGGEYQNNAIPKQTFVMRLLEDGSLDPSFGTDGLWTTTLINQPFGTEIEMNIYDEVLVASNVSFTSVAISRLLINGTLDDTYGTNGISTINILEPVVGSRAQMHDMLIDSYEDVYLGVSMSGSNNLLGKASVFKIDYTGSLVSSFGTNGHFEFAEGTHYAMNFTEENKIISSVMNDAGLPFFFTTTKNGQIDSSPETDYTLASQSFASLNASVRLEDITVLSDGKIIATGYTNLKTSPYIETGISIRLQHIPLVLNNCAYENKIVGYYYSLFGICQDEQDYVYTTDDRGRVLKFDSEGTIVQTWKGRGASAIAADNNGYIYTVSQDSIYKFTHSGILIKSWGGSGSGDGQFNGAQDIAIGLDGSIFISDVINHRVQKFDANGNYLLQWNSHETGSPALSFMKALCTDKMGNVYVAGGGGKGETCIVQKFNSSGVWIETFNLSDLVCNSIAINPINQSIYIGSLGFSIYSSSGVFQNKIEPSTENYNIVAEKMYMKADGSFMATWPGMYQIQFYSAQNSLVDIWSGQLLDNNGRYAYVCAYAADNSGIVYVADNKFQIIKLSAKGEYIKKWGGLGSGDSQFRSIASITVSNNNLIYVTDSANATVKCFDADGNFIRKWGSKGTGSGQFNRPYLITVDNNNFVYVLDWGNCRIQKFSSTGTFILEWGSCQNVNGNFLYGNSLMTDSRDNIYLASAGSGGNILKFTSNGILLQTIALTDHSGNLDAAIKICIAGDNFFSVHPANMLLKRFDLEGSFISSCNFSAPYKDDVSVPFNLYMTFTGTAYIYDLALQYIVSVPNNVTTLPTSVHYPNSKNNEQDACLVFPNPTTGLFTIHTTETIDYVVVYDINGSSEKHTTIEIDTQLKGLLMVKVFFKNGTSQTSKLIKI